MLPNKLNFSLIAYSLISGLTLAGCGGGPPSSPDLVLVNPRISISPNVINLTFFQQFPSISATLTTPNGLAASPALTLAGGEDFIAFTANDIGCIPGSITCVVDVQSLLNSLIPDPVDNNDDLSGFACANVPTSVVLRFTVLDATSDSASADLFFSCLPS